MKSSDHLLTLYRILCYLFAKVTPVKKKVLNLMLVTTATAANLGMSSHYHVIRRSRRPILKTTFQKCSVKVIDENIYQNFSHFAPSESRIFCQWNLYSGFQSLAEFQIP